MSLLLTIFKIVSVLATLVLALLVASVVANRPPLFDAPGWRERLHIYLTTHVAQLSDQPQFPELEARDDARNAAAMYAQTLLAVKALGWEITAQDDKQHSIEAVVTTPLFKFKDDVRIWITTRSEGGSRFYARSQSRIGRGDFGANAKHLDDLMRAMDFTRFVIKT